MFRNMSGPTSWAVSLGLGLAGYVNFTLGLGIGDTDIFDWGGLLSALIGTFIGIMPGTTICGLADGAAWPVAGATLVFGHRT